MAREVSVEVSRGMRGMGFICSLLVVSIHINWPHEDSLSIGWFIYHGIVQGFARIAVPFFFMCSGFLLARHMDDEDWWTSEIAKRIKSLVVPFYFWTLVALVGVVLLRHENIFLVWKRLTGIDLTDFPFLLPLWYLRCLFLLVLISPVFKWMVSRFGFFCPLFFCLCGFFYKLIPSANIRYFLQIGVSIWGVVCFVMGMYLWRKRPWRLSKRLALYFGVVGLVMLFLKFFFIKSTLGSILSRIALPFLIYSIFTCMCGIDLPKWITKCTFPIYLMHGVVILWFGELSMSSCGSFCGQSILFAGSVTMPILVSLLLRRITPGISAVIFGGR